jgi:hypothetical protein
MVVGRVWGEDLVGDVEGFPVGVLGGGSEHGQRLVLSDETAGHVIADRADPPVVRAVRGGVSAALALTGQRDRG